VLWPISIEPFLAHSHHLFQQYVLHLISTLSPLETVEVFHQIANRSLTHWFRLFLSVTEYRRLVQKANWEPTIQWLTMPLTANLEDPFCIITAYFFLIGSNLTFNCLADFINNLLLTFVTCAVPLTYLTTLISDFRNYCVLLILIRVCAHWSSCIETCYIIILFLPRHLCFQLSWFKGHLINLFMRSSQRLWE